MEHLAILSKQSKLLAKILSGEKTIESRWYKFKKTPYENIAASDVIYFKESGEAVTARAGVAKVLFVNHLDEEKIEKLLEQYGKEIGVSMTYAEKVNGKNFCTLIFLEKVERIEPFEINKKGYGLMAAWITIDKIEKIKA
ncbi:MAG: hypothetical protein Q8R47_03690 [Nanoarchaeota archaeon]|nr:hypothetical protein [Nanoarchaeota archaeon]